MKYSTRFIVLECLKMLEFYVIDLLNLVILSFCFSRDLKPENILLDDNGK